MVKRNGCLVPLVGKYMVGEVVENVDVVVTAVVGLVEVVVPM